MFVISQELKDAFLKLEFWEAEYRNIWKHLSLKFMCFFFQLFTYLFLIFYFPVMILDDNMQKLKARCLGNIVVK